MPQNVHFRQRAPAPPPMAPKWYLHKDDIVGTWGESNSPRFYNFCVRQFVCGSSCHCLFSGLILFSFLSLTFSWHFILPCGCQKIERESKKPRMKARMRPKQRKWMNCCTQKWLNLGLLDSPQVYYYQMVEVPDGEDVLDEDWVGIGYDENPGVQPADRLHQQLLHTCARYSARLQNNVASFAITVFSVVASLRVLHRQNAFASGTRRHENFRVCPALARYRKSM